MNSDQISALVKLYDKHKTDFLVVLFYIDEYSWEGEINTALDAEIFKIFSNLESDQKSDIYRYIEGTHEQS